MHKKAIFYSIDEKITPTQLKKLDNIKLENEDKFLKYCKENDIKAKLANEVNLKKTKNPPYILYYIWNYDLILNKKIVWIVGPRKITPFIKQYLDKFFENIKDFENIAIVSGLADGTDTYAHQLSIKYKIPTIAVLWFGIAKGLSSTTRHIIKEIVENDWLVLSEFKLKQTWTNWTFPQRNRIIAWLSDILFVPQAMQNSWTLITIEQANKIKIPVYSCFSDIEDLWWKWTNEQIVLWNINWIYDFNLFLEYIKKQFWYKKKKKKINLELNEKEKLIVENIQKWNNTLEKLVFATNLETSEILNYLSILEIKWIVKNSWWMWKI